MPRRDHTTPNHDFTATMIYTSVSIGAPVYAIQYNPPQVTLAAILEEGPPQVTLADILEEDMSPTTLADVLERDLQILIAPPQKLPMNKL